MVNRLRSQQQDTAILAWRVKGQTGGPGAQELGLPNRNWNHGHMSSRSWSHGEDAVTVRDTSTEVGDYSVLYFLMIWHQTAILSLNTSVNTH